MTKSCLRYLSRLTAEERWNVLVNAVDRLIETEEVSYLPDDEDCDEALIWDSCGDSLTESPEN